MDNLQKEMKCSPFGCVTSEEKCEECGGWFGDHDDDCDTGNDEIV